MKEWVNVSLEDYERGVRATATLEILKRVVGRSSFVSESAIRNILGMEALDATE